jgi:hypothetical protein
MKDSAAHCNAVLLFLCNCLGLILNYVGKQAVPMHLFALWFYCLLDIFWARCMAVLNVFVGAEPCCLTVDHYGHSRQQHVYHIT